MSNRDIWEGSRYVCLVRQSNDDDGDDSVLAQLKFLRAECDGDGMSYVDKIVLEGVTGSLPARRAHYTALIKRKLEKDDFDTLAVQKLDRATRGGGDFGIWLETELKLSGIRVRFVGEDIPTGRYSTMIKAAKYEAAEETAMSTGERTAQGQRFAKDKGTLKTTGQTPYGCWRLYYTLGGVPSHIIRNCGNGMQERLHVDTLIVLDTYGSTRKKSYGRYKKQKTEIALLRPGDKNEIRIVRVIFFLWFRWGWKGKRIASLLNKRKVPSPREKKWSQRQVESVLENEAYTGSTINGETYRGIYNRQKKGKGFEPLNRDEMEILTRATMPVTYTPIEDHDVIDQPLMDDFLPPHIRRLAIAYHDKLRAHKSDPLYGTKKAKKNKYPNSDYWLSNFMVTKQDGKVLVGHLAGPKDGPKTPYYRYKHRGTGYEKGSIFNRMFPMNPLHEDMCRFLIECLGNLPDLRQKLTALIMEQRRHAEGNDESLEALMAEREDIRERTQWMSRQSKKAREDAEPEMLRLDARRDELDVLIAQRQSQYRPSNEPVDRIVDRAIVRCQRLAGELPTLPSPTMRELMQVFFTRVEADMETKGVKLSIALPSYVLKARRKPPGEQDVDQTDFLSMCLGTTSRSPISSETHPIITLSSGLCRYVHDRGVHRPVCYECRRRAAA